MEIKKEVRNSDMCLICLSSKSVSKEGFVQKEISFALNVAEEKPEGTIYIVPIKLEDCDLPEKLSRWHYAEYFKDGGYDKLLKAIRKRAEGRRQPTTSRNRTRVKSSNIASIVYDVQAQILEVEFHNGSIYQYFDVPHYLYEELMSTGSHGKFLNTYIKQTRHVYKKIG